MIRLLGWLWSRKNNYSVFFWFEDGGLAPRRKDSASNETIFIDLRNHDDHGQQQHSLETVQRVLGIHPASAE